MAGKSNRYLIADLILSGQTLSLSIVKIGQMEDQSSNRPSFLEEP
jgi:hypothetical protein